MRAESIKYSLTKRVEVSWAWVAIRKVMVGDDTGHLEKKSYKRTLSFCFWCTQYLSLFGRGRRLSTFII